MSRSFRPRWCTKARQAIRVLLKVSTLLCFVRKPSWDAAGRQLLIILLQRCHNNAIRVTGWRRAALILLKSSHDATMLLRRLRCMSQKTRALVSRDPAMSTPRQDSPDTGLDQLSGKNHCRLSEELFIDDRFSVRGITEQLARFPASLGSRGFADLALLIVSCPRPYPLAESLRAS